MVTASARISTLPVACATHSTPRNCNDAITAKRMWGGNFSTSRPTAIWASAPHMNTAVAKPPTRRSGTSAPSRSSTILGRAIETMLKTSPAQSAITMNRPKIVAANSAPSRTAASRSTVAAVPLGAALAATIFGLFIVIALCAGLVFNIVSIALPKIVDERLGADVPLVLVGGLASAVFMCGAIAQITVGRLVERFPPHILFAVIASLQFLGVLFAAQATGKWLTLALAIAMAAIFAQVTVNDLV